MPRGTRTSSEIFRAVLRDAEKEIALASQQASSFKQTGIRGDERAAALMRFLRQHLPAAYGVGKGEAMDYRDRKSGQLDVIIYDKSGSAPVYGGAENVLVPCEALFAVIEVKTTLSQNELNKSYKAANVVRSLRPFKEKFVGPRTGGAPADDNRARCMFLVFAYQSDLGVDRWLAKEFRRVKMAAEQAGANMDVIERIVVLSHGMINPCDASGKECEEDDQGIFLEFYLHLVNFLDRERGRRQAVDWQIYSSRSAKGWKVIPSEKSG